MTPFERGYEVRWFGIVSRHYITRWAVSPRERERRFDTAAHGAHHRDAAGPITVST